MKSQSFFKIKTTKALVGIIYNLNHGLDTGIFDKIDSITYDYKNQQIEIVYIHSHLMKIYYTVVASFYD